MPWSPQFFADDNKKYLSTDLLRDEPVKSHYRAPGITLTGSLTVRRVCNVCCDAEGCDQRATIVWRRCLRKTSIYLPRETG